jgi:hypothetical protein
MLALKKSNSGFSQELFLIILVSGYLLNLIYYLLNLGRDFPYNTFLWYPEHKYTDFSSNWFALRDADLTAGSGYTILDYLPLWNFIHFLFSRISNFEIARFIYLSVLVIFTYNLINKYVIQNFPRPNLTLLNCIIIFSYPVLFVFDRGNIEFMAFVFLFLFFVTSDKHMNLKFIFFTFSCLIKPWALILVPVLIYKYRSIFVKKFFPLYIFTIITVPVIISYYFFKNIDTILNFNKTLNMYKDYSSLMIFDRVGLAYSHSLYNFISIFVNEFDIKTSRLIIFISYALFCLFVTIFIYLDFFKIKYPIWKFYSLSVVLMNLLPFVSADYRLLNIYILLYMFLINIDRFDGNDRFALYLLALLLIPKNIFIGEYTLGSIVNPTILLLVALIIFKSRQKVY